jgi:hypothetical protein
MASNRGPIWQQTDYLQWWQIILPDQQTDERSLYLSSLCHLLHKLSTTLPIGQCFLNHITNQAFTGYYQATPAWFGKRFKKHCI